MEYPILQFHLNILAGIFERGLNFIEVTFNSGMELVQCFMEHQFVKVLFMYTCTCESL